MAQYVGVGSLGRIVAELGVFKRNLECIRTTWEAPEQETPPCVVHSGLVHGHPARRAFAPAPVAAAVDSRYCVKHPSTRPHGVLAGFKDADLNNNGNTCVKFLL